MPALPGVASLQDMVNDLFGRAVSLTLDQLMQAVAGALVSIMRTLGTLWISTPTPGMNGPAGTTIAIIQSELLPVTGFVLMLSIIIGGTRIAWERQPEPAKRLLASLLTAVVVTSGCVATMGVLIPTLDTVAQALVPKEDLDTLTSGLAACLKAASANPATPGGGVFLALSLAALALLVSVVQIVLLLVRSGMLVILLSVLPLAASFSNLELGRQWLHKCLGWTLAFLLYKPVAALIFHIGFSLIGQSLKLKPDENPDPLLTALSGLTILSLSVLAMPAMMRFCVPLVQAAAAGSLAAAIPSGSPSGAAPTGAASTGAASTSPTGSDPVASDRPQGSSQPSKSTGADPAGSSTVNTGGPGGGGTGGASTAPGGATKSTANPAANPSASLSSNPAAAAGSAKTAGAGAAAGPLVAGAFVAAKGAAKAGKSASELANNLIDTTGGPSGSR